MPCENKKIFNLIVVNEVVRGEAAAYIGFYDTNSFNKLELKWGEFSIISIAQFEYLVASNKLEEFIEECDLRSRKMVPRPHYDDISKALNILFDVDLFLPPNYSFWEDGMRRLGINI